MNPEMTGSMRGTSFQFVIVVGSPKLFAVFSTGFASSLLLLSLLSLLREGGNCDRSQSTGRAVAVPIGRARCTVYGGRCDTRGKDEEGAAGSVLIEVREERGAELEGCSLVVARSLVWSEIHRPTWARTNRWALSRSVSEAGLALTK